MRSHRVNDRGKSPCIRPFIAGASASTPLSDSSTQHMLELLAGNRTAVLPRLARGRRIRSYPDLCASKFKKTNLKQGAHMHQPTPRPGQYLTLSIVFLHRIRNYNDIAIKVRVRFPFTLQFFSGLFQPLRLFILLRRSC